MPDEIVETSKARRLGLCQRDPVPAAKDVRLNMGLRVLCIVVALGIAILDNVRAGACGFVEAPLPCEATGPEREAQWMLGRAAAAIEHDKAPALRDFTSGERGFRTADTYVFCIGSDGIISAHPSPALQGRDVHDLQDEAGNDLIRTMMENAEAGRMSEIRSLVSLSGEKQTQPITTFYTRAGDQVCGIDVRENADRPVNATPEERVKQLRTSLDGKMPAEPRSGWTAYLDALNTELDARDALLAKVRRKVLSMQAALGPSAAPSSSGD